MVRKGIPPLRRRPAVYHTFAVRLDLELSLELPSGNGAKTDKNIILSHGAVAFMWEEHPEYQKAQAKAIGLGVGVLFVIGIIYCVSIRDWAHLKLVLSAAAGLAIALAILSLAARLIVKVFSRCQNRGKPQPNHGTDLSSRHDRET